MEMRATVSHSAERAIRERRATPLLKAFMAAVVLASFAANGYLVWKVLRLREALAGLRRHERTQELQAGSMAPVIWVTDLDGQGLKIDFSRTDRPTVLYFFVPGCESCDRNVENIKSLAASRGAEYRFLGLSLSSEGLQQYAESQAFNFPIYHRVPYETGLAYKLGKTPHAVVVSPEGKVLANWRGEFVGETLDQVKEYFGLATLALNASGK